MQFGEITLAAVRRLDYSDGIEMVWVRGGECPTTAKAVQPELEGGISQEGRSGQGSGSGQLQEHLNWSPKSALFFLCIEVKAVLTKRPSHQGHSLLHSLRGSRGTKDANPGLYSD